MLHRRRGRFTGLGLRNRVALGFALIGLLQSLVLAVAGAAVVSSYVDHHSERSATAQTIDNTALLKAKVVSLAQDPGTVMDELQFPAGAEAVLLFRGERYPSASAGVPLPAGVVRPLDGGPPVVRRLTLGGQERLVVGAPFGNRRGDALYEVFALTDLRSTLRALWLILLVAAVATSVLGLVIGRVASRLLLQPLTDVTAAAAAIAAGDLSARLRPGREPDLAGLARSFNRTAERLEERVHADARFAGDVSHELRTPLTTMLNSLAGSAARRAS